MRTNLEPLRSRYSLTWVEFKKKSFPKMCTLLVQDTRTDKGLRQNDDVISEVNTEVGNVSV
jgi:hypothetical protein